MKEKPTEKTRRLIVSAKSVEEVEEELPFELTEFWIWNGDLNHALSYPDAEPGKWMVEKGVLTMEDDRVYGVKDLLVGDVVYRVRKTAALDRQADPAECFFDWFLLDSRNGKIIAHAGIKSSPQTNHIISGI